MVVCSAICGIIAVFPANGLVGAAYDGADRDMDPTGATPQEVPTPLFGGRGYFAFR
jgi:hypothetical protein